MSQDRTETNTELCRLALPYSSIGSVCGLPRGHVGDCGEPIASTPRAPDRTEDLDRAEELCDWAWTIIANAGGGDWDRETDEWRNSAERWRDRWHAYLADFRTRSEGQAVTQDRTETRVVLVKPGDLLLIGNTGGITQQQYDAAYAPLGAMLKEQLNVRTVFFPGDIDIAALAEGEIPAEATP
jgi:hypothetical protein